MVVIVVVPVDLGLGFVDESIADEAKVDDSPVGVVATAAAAAVAPAPARTVVVWLIPSVTW